MTISYLDNTHVTSTTTGTGTLTQVAAVTGYRAPGAADDGKTFTVMIKAVDASGIPTGEWELCESVYSHSGTTWTRGTLLDSSTGSRVSFAAGTKRIAVVLESSAISTFKNDFLSALSGAEISITTTATTTISRMHVCSGTTADYTVTLPTAVGNADKFIAVRMAPGLTKIVTIDGNGTELIDGALTRVMWAGESATLKSDGANWFKVGGRSIPMVCSLSLSTGSTIASGAWIAIPLNVSDVDNTGTMADTSTSRIYCRRSGIFEVSGGVGYAGSADGSAALPSNLDFAISTVTKNTTVPPTGRIAQVIGCGFTGGYALPQLTRPISLVSGDYIKLGAICGYVTGTVYYYHGDFGCVLNLSEVLSW